MEGHSKFSLDGMVAIITGGSTGIGFAIARAMAGAGASVSIAARTRSEVESSAKEIQEMGGKALGIPTDVTSAEQVRALVQRTYKEFGRVDILVNNAGATSTSAFKGGPLLQLEERDFDGCLALNLKSVFLCCKEAVPIMMEQKKGVVINIGSIAGRETWPPEVGHAAYAAAKAGVHALTRNMAVEWGPHVRVNCIAPGMVGSERVTAFRPPERIANLERSIALERVGAPEEVAWAAVFLASDAAAWISGALLDVHGGLRSMMPRPGFVNQAAART